MNKYGAVVIVVAVTIILYLFMLIAIPLLSDMASTANTTMATSSNLSNYPGAAEGMLAAPLWMMFVPGGICVAVVVGILRTRS